ncbi:MAG TPA: sugar phosphate nucleotidyltransferase [Methylomusa anaerophila]|uniref:Glucose-1-phosphate adenylyltransferase n=1 Tax=Methylomusa anaerophila TaxID=1930071 RepID=A0A348ALR9_9FIRM|nr:sugar phosphate nucleotidyltransferase [Methylomusa anaerophila]BBB92017.1 glucose-1-phosphate adenylyltransferase [Methylomusa anaerophila]HML87971.1 sugar phosphate nucleotidyltransferase [Methylomusa anaerophila]
MSIKECIAMILAGGQESHLAALTTEVPQSAVPFGGSCRLIDFPLSNCYNSGIDTVGVLTSRQPFEMNGPIDSRTAQSLPHDRFNIHMLPPAGMDGLFSYTGTANALYENIDFIQQFSPEYILVLAADHVYQMDYSLLIKYHKEKGADATIAVIEVPWSEAPRFGIMTTRLDGSVAEFIEKPVQPKSNLASMGVYIFSWSKLKYYLGLDEANPSSKHDFGKNIIPAMLSQGEQICAYPFKGYWRDVGTVKSLYEAHMDLLSSPPIFRIQNMKWPIYSTLNDLPLPASIINHKRRKSFIGKNCCILGEIDKSIIFPDTYIGNKAIVKNSVVMPGAYVGPGAYVESAIIGPGAAVENGCPVLGGITEAIAVIGQNAVASYNKSSGVKHAINLGEPNYKGDWLQMIK